MTEPLVSICLPNLNTRPFLPERVRTILRQTYGNWELIVSDNYSEDGAWDFFREIARSDSRISIAQAPREGMYANWNRCISRACGEFIYIATSDDTMSADRIEKLVTALLAHPDCDLAHARSGGPSDRRSRSAQGRWETANMYAEHPWTDCCTCLEEACTRPLRSC